MNVIHASAPGKLVLSGEYVVLDGAPALAMAVDCRAQVTIQPADGDEYVVDSRGETRRFEPREDGIRFSADDGRFGLLEFAWAASTPECAQRLTLDTESFFDTASGRKLGLGSSAALTVALCRALLPRDTSMESVFNAATRAHRAFQTGVGSGVDVASACFGGVLEYRMDAKCEPRAWPDERRQRIGRCRRARRRSVAGAGR